MITIANKVNIHDSWDELTPEETLKVIDLLDLLFNEVDLVEFRLRLLSILSGYKRSKKKFKRKEMDRINENLLLLADRLRFPIQFTYTPIDRFATLSPVLKKKLKKYLPFEIYDVELLDELKTAGKLEPHLQIDIFWKKNPVPTFQYRGIDFNGPIIDIDKFGLLKTSLTAGEYVDVLSYYNAYLETKEESFLVEMLAILYRPEGMKYSDIELKSNVEFLKSAPSNYKRLAFYLVQNLVEFISKRSAYSLLYSTTKNKSDNKIDLGSQAIIYDLTKAGYGTDDEIRNTNLVNFLNMQIDKLKSFVAECRAYKLKDTEIAKKYGIPITILKQL